MNLHMQKGYFFSLVLAAISPFVQSGVFAEDYTDWYGKINLFSSAKGLAFNKNDANKGISFAKAKRYEEILIGAKPVQKAERAAFHKTLASVFSSSMLTLKNELLTELPAKTEEIIQYLESSHPVAEFHTAIYDNFLFSDEFIVALIKIANSKFFFSLEDLSLWRDSFFFTKLCSLKLFSLPNPQELPDILREQRAEIATIYSNLTDGGKNSLEIACSFLELFTLEKGEEFAREQVFTTEYNAIWKRRNAINANDWSNYALTLMKEKSKGSLDFSTLKRGIPSQITKWKFREALIAQHRFFEQDLKAGFEEALDFDPKTWQNLNAIIKLLEEIPLQGQFYPISRLESALKWTSVSIPRNDEAFPWGNADDIKQTFLSPQGIFTKVKEAAQRKLLFNLKDLEGMKNDSAAAYFHDFDPFGVKAIYGFLREIKEPLGDYFSLNDEKEALDEIDFSKYHPLIKANGIEALKMRMKASSVHCPSLNFEEFQDEFEKKDLLKQIYQTSLDYVMEHWENNEEYAYFKDKLHFVHLISNEFGKKDNILARNVNIGNNVDFSKVNPLQFEKLISDSFPREELSVAVKAIDIAVGSGLLTKLFAISFKEALKENWNFDSLIEKYPLFLDCIKLVEYNSLSQIFPKQNPSYVNLLIESGIFNFKDHFENPSVEFFVQAKEKLNSFPIIGKYMYPDFGWAHLGKLTTNDSRFMRREECTQLKKLVKTLQDATKKEKVFLDCIDEFKKVLVSVFKSEDVQTEEDFVIFVAKFQKIVVDEWIEKFFLVLF